jgi:hypothetical protein
VAALQGALAAEHAAVYGFGVVGAMLAGSARASARGAWLAHQHQRDSLTAEIEGMGATPVAAAPAYELPFPVTGASSAKRLAATLEDGVTSAYLGVVAVSDPTLRAFGAQMMQTSANRASIWSGTTVAFPGMPA